MDDYIKRKRMCNLAKALKSVHRFTLNDVCMWCEDRDGSSCTCGIPAWRMGKSLLNSILNYHYRWALDQFGLPTIVESLPIYADVDTYFPPAPVNLVYEEICDFVCPDLNVKIEEH
jgi:hypothetical protein